MTFINRDVEFSNPHITTNSNFFLIRVNGDSMINSNISEGDYLLVERNSNDVIDKIVIAELNGAWTVKILKMSNNGNLLLVPSNKKYREIEISEEDKFRVIGKVVKVIKSFN